MKPAFRTLWAKYPATESREVLYRGIGWADVIDHPAFHDTCAIRMSLALAGAGVNVKGNMKVHAGPLKGKSIQTGQGRLSNTLDDLWGKPEVYRGEEAARAGIGKRAGVISFFRILGGTLPSGGHIDLVYPGSNGFSMCARSCFFTAAEIWFWPLQ